MEILKVEGDYRCGAVVERKVIRGTLTATRWCGEPARIEARAYAHSEYLCIRHAMRAAEEMNAIVLSSTEEG